MGYRFLVFLAILGNFGILFPSLFSFPLEDEEEILIAFTCSQDNLFLKPSFQDWYREESSRLVRENGKIFFLNLTMASGDSTMVEEFMFRNGSFALVQNPFSSTLSTKYRFVLYWQKVPFEATHWKSSGFSHQDPYQFYLFTSGVPGEFQKNGNQIYLSCPNQENQWRTIRMVFRERVLIRLNWNTVEAKNFYGDYSETSPSTKTLGTTQ